MKYKQNYFFEKKSGFGKGERVEGRYGDQTGFKAALFLEIRVHIFKLKLRFLPTESP